MAKMLIQSESLTAIADKIRVLSGTTEAMGLDAMANHIGEANTDVATEADLIEQIASALEGKAGGSGGSLAADTYTVRNNLSYEVYVGGTCIPAGTSILFPVSQGTVTLMSILVKSINNTLSAYLNSASANMTLYTSQLAMPSGSTINIGNGLSGCYNWIIMFTSAPKSGDVIDIGANS